MKYRWVTAALSDDTVVAELLLRLKQSSSQLPAMPPSLSLPLGWGHRQPRSKPTTKKDSKTTTTTTRCSPITPLSWSDGGYDDSSNSSLPSSDLSRSKDAFGNDTTVFCSNNKRWKRKKTCTELKEEENLLLKERVTLKRELASLHVTLEEQKARSENLKRIKIDINLQTSGDTDVGFCNKCTQMEASTSDHANSALPRHAVQDGFGSPGSCRVEKEVSVDKSYFFLPDLNMIPSEEEIGPEILNGIS